MANQETERNREIVLQVFDAWVKGGDRFFDILAPDAIWTIEGSGPSARTYQSKQSYVDEVMKPLQARIAGRIVPRLRNLWADGDHVIVRWDQEATTRDGKPYREAYAWFFKMEDGKVVKVTAFLDLPAYDALLDRVAPTHEK